MFFSISVKNNLDKSFPFLCTCRNLTSHRFGDVPEAILSYFGGWTSMNFTYFGLNSSSSMKWPITTKLSSVNISSIDPHYNPNGYSIDPDYNPMKISIFPSSESIAVHSSSQCWGTPSCPRVWSHPHCRRCHRRNPRRAAGEKWERHGLEGCIWVYTCII